MDYFGMIKDCQYAFSRMQDDESRQIFIERMLYSLTNDSKHIKNIVYLNKIGKRQENFLTRPIKSVYLVQGSAE